MHSLETCKRKVRYRTEGTAKRGLDQMTKKGRHGLEVYRCGHCHGYHLGHAFKPQISVTLSGTTYIVNSPKMLRERAQVCIEIPGESAYDEG